MNECPNCRNSHTVFTAMSVEYLEAHSLYANMAYTYCTECGDEWVDKSQMIHNDDAVRNAKMLRELADSANDAAQPVKPTPPPGTIVKEHPYPWDGWGDAFGEVFGKVFGKSFFDKDI